MTTRCPFFAKLLSLQFFRKCCAINCLSIVPLSKQNTSMTLVLQMPSYINLLLTIIQSYNSIYKIASFAFLNFKRMRMEYLHCITWTGLEALKACGAGGKLLELLTFNTFVQRDMNIGRERELETRKFNQKVFPWRDSDVDVPWEKEKKRKVVYLIEKFFESGRFGRFLMKQEVFLIVHIFNGLAGKSHLSLFFFCVKQNRYW